MVRIKKGHTLIIAGCFFIFFFLAVGIIKISGLNHSTDSTPNPLINISKLSEEYMAKYRDDYSKMVKLGQPENILIISSSAEPANTYGATMVVNAANNQYFLQYRSKEEKDNALKWLKDDPNLKVSENVPHEYSEESENSSSYNSWGIEKMGLDHMKDVVANYPAKNNITVAVVDSGLDVARFKANFPDKELEVYNSVNPSAEMSDEVGHGTHTTGTVAEGTPDNVKILSVKLSEGQQVFSTDIIAAIDYISYYEKADVINMSFGSSIYSDAEYLSMEAAKQKNIIGVAAAGNSGGSVKNYPAAFDNTISVSAVDKDLNFADFSTFGSTVTFAAPGVDIASITDVESGTSMAAPHITAAAAVAKSLKKDLTLDETISFLSTRAIDLGVAGRDARYGYGFVDFNGAKLCGTDPSEQCDEFAILEHPVESGIEITDVILTPYNYGSLTNILASKIKILNSDGTFTEKALGDLGVNVEISGYDPYASGEQQVVVAYNGYSADFTVENPENYQSGWLYEGFGDQMTLVDYKNHGLAIKTLYLPESIDGKTVTRTIRGCKFFSGSYQSENCYNAEPSDARYYETVVMPTNIRYTAGFSGESFQNLAHVISLADELTVANSAFSRLPALTKVDANVLFEKYTVFDGVEYHDEYAQGVFSESESLESVKLSDNNVIIPSNTFYRDGNLSTVVIPDSVEKIDDNAFTLSGLDSITIPSSATEVSPSAFSRLALKTLAVADGNPVYDSRENSNSLILTAEDKLVLGTASTIIPDSIKTIGSDAFTYLDALSEIIIPEGVEIIESNAFHDCYYLTKVVLPKSLTQIEDNSFNTTGVSTPSNTVFWVYEGSYALSRVREMDVPYIIIDPTNPSSISILNATYESIPAHRIFQAFETFSPDNFIIKVHYFDENTNTPIEEPEIITDYTVKYSDQFGVEHDTLSGGMNFVTFTFDTAAGFHNVKMDMQIMVWQLDPEYEVPADISAREGQILSEIELPEGFSWANENQVIDASTDTYPAVYTPADSLNYKTIRNIPINIRIIPSETLEEIFPDEALRTCIVQATNEQLEADYTLDTITLDEVLSIEQLHCPYIDGQTKIRDARGIEKLASLKSLDLSGNDIEKINLSSNTQLTQLNLLDNPIKNLDVTHNPELEVFWVNESRLPDGECLTVKTVAYLEVPQEDSSVRLRMDLTGVKFIMTNHWAFEVPPYITPAFNEGGIGLSAPPSPGELRMHLTREGDTRESVFSLDINYRSIIFSLYLDGTLFTTDRFGETVTGATIDIDSIEQTLSAYFLLSYNYVLENSTVLSSNTHTVGTDDVHLNLYYKKINQETNGDTGDTGNTGDTGDAGDTGNNGNTGNTDNTGGHSNDGDDDYANTSSSSSNAGSHIGELDNETTKSDIQANVDDQSHNKSATRSTGAPNTGSVAREAFSSTIGFSFIGIGLISSISLVCTGFLLLRPKSKSKSKSRASSQG